MPQTKDVIKQHIEAQEWEEILLPTGDPALDKAIQLQQAVLALPMLAGNYDLAFRRAVFGRQKAIVPLLLSKIHNIHTPSASQHGRSALHFAAANGDTDLVKILIAAGAWVNLLDSDWNTPLHLACQHNHPDTALALAEAGAFTMQNRENKTPKNYIDANRATEQFADYFAASAEFNHWHHYTLPSIETTEYAWLLESNTLSILTLKSVNAVDMAMSISEHPVIDLTADAPHSQEDKAKLERVMHANKFKYIARDDMMRVMRETSYTDVISATTMLQTEGVSYVINIREDKLKILTQAIRESTQLEALLGVSIHPIFQSSAMDTYFFKSDTPVSPEIMTGIDSDLYRTSTDQKLIILRKNFNAIIEKLQHAPPSDPGPSSRNT